MCVKLHSTGFCCSFNHKHFWQEQFIPSEGLIISYLAQLNWYSLSAINYIESLCKIPVLKWDKKPKDKFCSILIHRNVTWKDNPKQNLLPECNGALHSLPPKLYSVLISLLLGHPRALLFSGLWPLKFAITTFL